MRTDSRIKFENDFATVQACTLKQIWPVVKNNRWIPLTHPTVVIFKDINVFILGSVCNYYVSFTGFQINMTWHCFVYCLGGNSVEVKTEADDTTEYSYDEQSSSGLFGLNVYRLI